MDERASRTFGAWRSVGALAEQIVRQTERALCLGGHSAPLVVSENAKADEGRNGDYGEKRSGGKRDARAPDRADKRAAENDAEHRTIHCWTPIDALAAAHMSLAVEK